MPYAFKVPSTLRESRVEFHQSDGDPGYWLDYGQNVTIVWWGE